MTMCDCAGSEDVSDSSIEAITIFQKCTNLTLPNTICAEKVVDAEELNKVERGRIISDVCEATSYTDDVCSTTLSSSECSTDSARAYQFVNHWELECKCDGGYEDEEFEDKSSCGIGRSDESDTEGTNVECTLAIIKPEAVVHRTAIERRIRESGLAIQQTRSLRLTSEQVSEFYGDDYGNSDFARIVAYMSSGPIIVHVLANKRAVQQWRTLMGPTKVSDARLYFPDSVRARYGRKGQDYQNAVHGSASREEAEREIHFFFPDFIVEPFQKWEKCEIYLSEAVNEVLVKGLALCCSEKPTDPILWLANWLLANNPNAPKIRSQPD